jgi:hypothetical protein
MLPLSCATKSGGENPAGPTGANVRTADEWLSETTKDNGFVQDAKGNLVPRSNKRSSFESQGRSPYFQNQYGKKEFNAPTQSKKSWWGNKDFNPKAYAGNTDGSRFQKPSQWAGKGARESNDAARIPGPYQTGTYQTEAAREAGKNSLKKPSDAETDLRRNVYAQPEIIDWRQQRALSVEQSKGIMGR